MHFSPFGRCSCADVSGEGFVVSLKAMHFTLSANGLAVWPLVQQRDHFYYLRLSVYCLKDIIYHLSVFIFKYINEYNLRYKNHSLIVVLFFLYIISSSFTFHRHFSLYFYLLVGPYSELSLSWKDPVYSKLCWILSSGNSNHNNI